MRTNINNFFLTLIATLALGIMGCRNDNEIKCYTAEVITAQLPYIKDVIQLQIIETPDDVSGDKPRVGSIISVPKSDFTSYNLQKGDVVDFRIIECETIFPYIGAPAIYSYSEYSCRVVPCE